MGLRSAIKREVKAPMLDSGLGYVYNALYPLVKTASFPRPGVRFHGPSHVLLPRAAMPLRSSPRA